MIDIDPDFPDNIREGMEAHLWARFLAIPSAPSIEQAFQQVENHRAFYAATVSPKVTTEQRQLSASLGAIVFTHMQAMETIINRQAEVIGRLESQVDRLEDHVNNLRILTLSLLPPEEGE